MPLVAESRRRRIVVRVLAALIALVAMVAALIAAILAPYYLSIYVAQTALLVLSGIATFAAVAWLGMRLCAALWRSHGPVRFASMSSGVLTGAFSVALYLLVLRPNPLHFTEVIPVAGTRYWQLPTGSRIAYLEYEPPAGVAVKPDPVVFLHGGPGLRFAPFDGDFYGKFAADGFRVYLYDQAGSGASPILAHIEDYTIARFVEDLEAIRLQLHTERMILIGHSWGSTLAASYMARYPDHVSKAIFHSPGPIWSFEDARLDLSFTDAGKDADVHLGAGLPPPRFLAGLYLMQQNPHAAENLLSQREAGEIFAPLEAQNTASLVCKGASGRIPSFITGIKDRSDNPGLNPYVLLRLEDETEIAADDPHAALRTNKTPAIVLVGECNFLSWETAADYRKTFPNLKIFYILKAGHFIPFEQPELMTNVLRAFLLDQPDAIPPYTAEVDPRSLTHGDTAAR